MASMAAAASASTTSLVAHAFPRMGNTSARIAAGLSLYAPLSLGTSSLRSPRNDRNAHLSFSYQKKNVAGPVAMDSNSEEATTLEIAAAVSGLIALPVVSWSLYTLKTTGCGLPPGPGGSLGALEGISFLVLLGLVGWSLVTKAQTGSGLKSGPGGLLGAVEGLSYLLLLAAIAVFGLQVLDYGYIPPPVPGEQCFG
eukprot:TRINITY_DN831_c0_g1_i3.p1 TRINITY_DN831_c0_g1~~TRINITY_DN831_c0_g1_i3.p1  ORF type:complete len:197 (+),score=36.42 TRINITY_DN831_c0_g1_i3:57-647(+)